VIWAGVEDVPILYANTFISQFDPTSMGGFILTVGQLTPPVLLGTEDEIKEQAERVSYVPVRAVARIAVTRGKLDELIAILESTKEKFDRATNMSGDPRA
jgi:hypothetical protein